MAWDDPVVWVLIIAVLVFIFGSSKIPQFAKSLGQARREFQRAVIEPSSQERLQPPPESQTNPGAGAAPRFSSPSSATVPPPIYPARAETDPLTEAAEREGISTRGKTRDQIASELAARLSGR